MTAERPRVRFAKRKEMSFFIVISDIFLAASAAMLAMIVIMKAAEPGKSLVTTNLDLHCRKEGEGVVLSRAPAANGSEDAPSSYPSLDALLNAESPAADLMLVVGLDSSSDEGCYLEVARQADALNLQKNKREGIGPLVSLKPVDASSGAKQ